MKKIIGKYANMKNKHIINANLYRLVIIRLGRSQNKPNTAKMSELWVIVVTNVVQSYRGTVRIFSLMIYSTNIQRLMIYSTNIQRLFISQLHLKCCIANELVQGGQKGFPCDKKGQI